MGLSHDRGARAERAAAKFLHGRRVGNVGKAGPDVVTDWAVVEVKARRSLPVWLKNAMRQVEGAACASVSPKQAIVQLHELGGRVADDLVVMRASDFKAWHGDWRGNRAEE